MIEQRKADEEALRRRRFGDFDFLADSKKFVEEQEREKQKIQDAINKEVERGLQQSVEMQDKANEAEANKPRPEPQEDRAILFGSSDASRIQAKAERGNAAMLSELRKIRDAINRKAPNMIAIKDLN